uniref:Branchpoint-bridging protein n=1 Tax=Anopheles stephensi TaxID=30069 RepID=A0A182YCJ5_ANOST
MQLQIEEISRQLRTGDVTVPEERSPSPEPIYDPHGKRLNTRVNRAREKLKEQRHRLIQQLLLKNPTFKPPSDYKPPVAICSDKVVIPQEEYPNINFIGLLIGPRGNTLKAIEKDTGAKIIIRGKGSAASSKVKSVIAADEPLHALVTANTSEAVTKAVGRIREIIQQGVNEPNLSNHLRRQQLFELAQINGTLRQPCVRKSWPNPVSSVVCLACGGGGHITSDCRANNQPHNQNEKQPAGENVVPKYDEPYLDFLAEIGEAPSRKKCHHGGTQQNEACGNNPTSAQDQSRAASVQKSAPLTQQEESSQYPSPYTATFTDATAAVPSLINYMDPLLTYYPQSNASTTSKVSGWTNECSVLGSSQHVQQPPSETSTSAFMDLAQGHYYYWPNVPASINEYGTETVNYLNLGYWTAENAATYGYFLPPPGDTAPKP